MCLKPMRLAGRLVVRCSYDLQLLQLLQLQPERFRWRKLRGYSFETQIMSSRGCCCAA